MLSAALFDLQRKYPRTCQWLPFLSCWLLPAPQRQTVQHSHSASNASTSQKDRAADSPRGPGLESDEDLTGTGKTPDTENLSKAGPGSRASEEGSNVRGLRVEQAQEASGMLSSREGAELNLRVEEALQLQVITL